MTNKINYTDYVRYIKIWDRQQYKFQHLAYNAYMENIELFNIIKGKGNCT